MASLNFTARSELGVCAERLARWHFRPGAFQRLSPPWAPPEVLEQPPALEDGARAVFRVPVGPFNVRWVAAHQMLKDELGFIDTQQTGPFREWRHTHRFVPRGEDGSTLVDSVDYRLPLGLPGRWLGGAFLRRDLIRLFNYRHQITRFDLERHARVETAPLRIAVSGAGGLVGTALVAFLNAGGHTVLPLVRRAARSADEIAYDVGSGSIDVGKLATADAVVHLAGESIAARRWSAEQKRKIEQSRVQGTELIARTLAGLRAGPRVLVNASAIGYYGDRDPGESLDEDAPAGTGFLADTCRAWERAVAPAEAAGLRVVRLRVGIVLAAAGGALATLLTPFRLGLGGRSGHGRQIMSWIGLNDLVGVIHRALVDEALSGAVNGVAPAAVSNREFARTLGRVLRRPAIFPAPARLLRLALGEMADGLILEGARVVPGKLRQVGFEFNHPELEAALRFELGRFARNLTEDQPAFS